MVSINRVLLAGTLTRDPELRETHSGREVASFSLAVNRRWRNREGEAQRETSFFPVVVWNGVAKNCAQDLTKGRSVVVEGRLQLRSYTAKSGEKRSVSEIVGEAVTFLPRRSPGGAAETRGTAEPALEAEMDENAAGGEEFTPGGVLFWS